MRAACAGLDPEIMFPDSEDPEAVAAAKAVCASCSMLDECRAASLDEKHGVWGGLTERERKTLRSGPRPRACGLCGETFLSTHGRRYCSTECRATSDHQRKIA